MVLSTIVLNCNLHCCCCCCPLRPGKAAAAAKDAAAPGGSAAAVVAVAGGGKWKHDMFEELCRREEQGIEGVSNTVMYNSNSVFCNGVL